MANSDSREVQCRLIAKKIVGTIVDPDRVILGLGDFAPNIDFFANLSPDGPFVVILPAKRANFDAQDRHYEIHVSIRIYFAIPADDEYDFTSIENVVSNIFQALVAVNSYVGNPANTDDVSPPNVPYNESGPLGNPDLKPLPYYYELTFAYYGSTQS